LATVLPAMVSAVSWFAVAVATASPTTTTSYPRELPA
jgi:hypothetical protein